MKGVNAMKEKLEIASRFFLCLFLLLDLASGIVGAIEEKEANGGLD